MSPSVSELPLITSFPAFPVEEVGAGPALFSSETGVNVKAYGLGQLTGAVFTVPAFSEIEVDFKLRLQAVTAESIKNMDNLIQSLLSASKREEYKEFEKIQASGGLGFSWFWSGGARASYEKTKERMEAFGLSEENQRTIVNGMIQLANSLQEFNYRGVVKNANNDFSVSGNLFGFVMDAEISANQETKQVRIIAPNAVLKDASGGAIAEIDPPLYQA